ncbi:MAG: sulfatase-like hydrolase/transferase [Victivallales bacterium]|jgi:arylsulfatase A-like enzyme|nr:sulfatase-like hydrolase/transferase [Victivallales bacterium]
MDRRSFLKRLSLGSVALGLGPVLSSKAAAGDRPNVLLIVCDDLNDYVNGYGGHPQARTPHLEALAATGVCFTRAYSNNPICAPSRSSFLTGVYPHTSKNHHFAKWFRNPVLKNSRTLMDHFRLNGYQTMGSGKLMHHHRPEEWAEYKHKADYGPFYHKDGQKLAHPNVPEPYSTIGMVDGSYGALEDIPAADKRGKDEGWVYGKWGKKPEPLKMRSGTDRDPTPDERNAAWAAGRIAELAKGDAGKPFLLGVGFIRPHTPLVVPRKYFDMFPLKDVKLPVRQEGDNEDTGMKDVVNEYAKGPLYFRMLRESYGGTLEGLRAFTQAYLASIAAVDDCIGQVLAALDKSPFRDNTIVVMTSDHGWNMGEKDWVFKMSLWEESCRVPLIIRAPGVAKAGGKAGHPVGLVDVYPTLVDLCGLQGDTRKNDKGAKLDGHSMRAFLSDPEKGAWDGPDAALSMVYSGADYEKIAEMQHYSVRTRDYRYIRYNNGFEELYDHGKDPYEWTNLAKQPEHAGARKKLRQQLDDLTGLKIGVIPPTLPTPLEKGEALEFTFEDFDVQEDVSMWPAKNRVSIMRDRAKVISGKASLQLFAPGALWNVANFRTIEVPPGLTCDIRFDCRAVTIKEKGYPYFLLARGKFKSGFTRIPIKVGETRTVTGTITNDQKVMLNLQIGFTKGGTYLIDNLKVSKKQ